MMARVPLFQMAVARSGDKGNSSNIGVMAKSPEAYQFLRESLTAEFVKDKFHCICRGSVTRYELPNLSSLNFILEESLGGGGTATLLTDAQGKVHGMALLNLEMEVPESVLATISRG